MSHTDISQDDLIQAFANLVQQLKDNHTLTNMSSTPSKADDYHAFLGRGGSVDEVLAKASGLDYHTFCTVSKSRKYSDGVFIDRFYLDALLNESSNGRLIESVKRDIR